MERKLEVLVLDGWLDEFLNVADAYFRATTFFGTEYWEVLSQHHISKVLIQARFMEDMATSGSTHVNEFNLFTTNLTLDPHIPISDLFLFLL